MSDYEIILREDVNCYSPVEIMQILNYSKASTYRLFRSKSFPSFIVGEKGLRITKTDFKKWQEDQKKLKESSYI